MLDVKKRNLAFFITIGGLGLVSGLSLTYCQRIFIEPFYEQSQLGNFFIAFLFISIITILQMFLKKKFNNLLVLGIICGISEIFFVVLISYPLVGFILESFLPHFMAVSSFCFFIPYTYKTIENTLM
jgi:hypothetical protein